MQVANYEALGAELSIHIEEYGEDVNWKEEIHFLTDCHEFLTKDVQLYCNVSHSILEVDEGTVFMVEDDATLRWCCLLTDRGPDGEVIVPDEPYETGEFDVDAGAYRVWDEVRKL